MHQGPGSPAVCAAAHRGAAAVAAAAAAGIDGLLAALIRAQHCSEAAVADVASHRLSRAASISRPDCISCAAAADDLELLSFAAAGDVLDPMCRGCCRIHLIHEMACDWLRSLLPVGYLIHRFHTWPPRNSAACSLS